MLLKGMCGALAIASMTVVAFAQQPSGNPNPPNPRVVLDQPDKTVTYASAADIAALVARAEREHKDDLPLVVGKVLQLAPYTEYLEYRRRDAKLHERVGFHQKDAELVYVLQGSGTLVTGGKMTADRTGIEGGQSQKVSKGDFFVIPERTPHLITHIDKTLALLSIHLPRPVPAQ